MRRATIFMVEKVATQGGFVWSYLPDMSRRWGEIEARPTMIWMQPPGTPTMGHLFLDAYHATGDEYYYRAADQVAGALMLAQHPAGGWNYVFDTAGEAPRREWYDTVGRSAWRLEEFQHDWGNATFDDGGTSQSTEFPLRLFLEKHDSKYKAALDRAIQFVLDSQDPVGAWPQRFPLKHEFSHHAKPDYTSFLTFNDEVTAGNVEHLLRFYRLTGDAKFLARIPEALDWLDAVKLPPDIAAIAGGGRTHPIFVELGTNKNLYVHRRGSNVVNGEYYVMATRTIRSATTTHSGRSMSRNCARTTSQRRRCRPPRPRRVRRFDRARGAYRCLAISPSVGPPCSAQRPLPHLPIASCARSQAWTRRAGGSRPSGPSVTLTGVRARRSLRQVISPARRWAMRATRRRTARIPGSSASPRARTSAT